MIEVTIKCFKYSMKIKDSHVINSGSMKWINVTEFAKTHHLRTQWQRTFFIPIDSSINKLTNCHNNSSTS